MAKAAKKTTPEQRENAVLAAALKRAIAQLDTGGAKPEPGTHTVSFTVDVEGDVVIGEPSTSARCSINANTALAAYAIDAGEKIEDWATFGVGLIRQQRRTKAGREALDEAVRRMDDAFRDTAEEAGFYTEVAKAGSVTGKPAISITHGGVLT